MAVDPAAQRRARARRRGIAFVAVLLVAAALGAWFATRPMAVDAVVLQRGPLVRTLQFTARVETPARVDAGPTLTGRVARVAVREGERFDAGAVLLQLEDDELRAAVTQAEASLRQARARQDAQRGVARPAADAALAQAEATLHAAARELERARELVAQGYVSQSRADDAERALLVARSQRDAARVQAESNRERGAETAATLAQLDAAVATAQVARARLAQATLRAPAPGRVIERDVEPGQIVQPGRALLRLAIDGPTELVAPVDERFLATLAPGQRARVVADAFPAQPFAARVVRLAPGVDALRGAVEVRLRPDGAAPGFLREDMTLSVEIVTGESADARVLPLRALLAGGDDDHGRALVVDHGRAAVRELQLGLRTLDRVEVRGGLDDGAVVLLDPAVEPGRRVQPRLIDADQASAGASRRSDDLRGGPMGAMAR
jgi:HlyD family secretion protein